MNPITRAISDVGGVGRLATALGVTYQAIRKWERAGRLPRTDLTGETRYAAEIARVTRGHVSEDELLTFTRKNWQARPGNNGMNAKRKAGKKTVSKRT
jgi:DNA-binding transcriptional regulator YdaS (Cro superfamily)